MHRLRTRFRFDCRRWRFFASHFSFLRRRRLRMDHLMRRRPPRLRRENNRACPADRSRRGRCTRLAYCYSLRWYPGCFRLGPRYCRRRRRPRPLLRFQTRGISLLGRRVPLQLRNRPWRRRRPPPSQRACQSRRRHLWLPGRGRNPLRRERPWLKAPFDRICSVAVAASILAPLEHGDQCVRGRYRPRVRGQVQACHRARGTVLAPDSRCRVLSVRVRVRQLARARAG